MIEFYNNNPASLIKCVGIIDDKQISLHGSKNILITNSESQIKNLFGYIDRIFPKNPVSPEIKDNIQKWFTQRNEKLQNLGNERYSYMKKIIEDKAQKAREENKKLLVVMGEEYHLPDPHFFQLLALDICKKINIKNVLLELPPSTILLTPGKNTTIQNYCDKNLFWNVLSNSQIQKNISLYPIDSLHDDYGNRTASPKTRDQAINKAILEVGEDALCITGGAHIHHIKTDPELSAKYEFAIFHTANLAYKEKYNTLPSKELETLLEKQESSILETEQEIQNAIKEKNLEKSDLNNKFTDYQDLTLEKMYLMKARTPQEIINLSLEDGTAKAIPSDTEALNIATTVIKQNNPTSKILIGLQALQNDYKELQEIQDCDQTPPTLDVDYLSGQITEKKYNKYKSSDNMKSDQMIYMILCFKPESLYDLSDDESSDTSDPSDESDQDAQQSVINPDLDLTGNWDVWPDC